MGVPVLSFHNGAGGHTQVVRLTQWLFLGELLTVRVLLYSSLAGLEPLT